MLLIVREKQAGLRRRTQALVRVEGDGVGELAAGHDRILASIGKNEEAAPARVDMMPHAVFFANFRNFNLIVKAAHNGGAHD